MIRTTQYGSAQSMRTAIKDDEITGEIMIVKAQVKRLKLRRD